MSTGERRRDLDGLRGIAVLLVLAAHLDVPGLGAGGIVGVTMFFTLSGYLITSLLLAELGQTGRLHLGGFYLRRVFRLLPALVALIAVMVAVGAASGRDAAWSLLYVGNWERATGGSLGALSHTWSLAIEEQFYLLWPLLIVLVGARRRLLLGIAVVGAAASVAARVTLWDDGAGLLRVYFGSDTRADAILLGCALALAAGRVFPARIGAAALVCALALSATVGAVAYVVAPALAAVATALVIASRGCRWLAHPALVLVGRRSYGLYLWHVPLVLTFGHTVDGLPWAVGAVVLAVTSWGLTLLSWRYVEAPFLRLKDRLPDRPAAPVRRLDSPRTHDTTPAREPQPVVAALHNP